MTRRTDTEEMGWTWWAVVTGAGCVVISVLVRLIGDVLSVNGLLYSFGLGTAEQIAYPLATRLVTWLGLLELCALAGAAGNYWAGRWKDRWTTNLLLGHVAFAGWIYRSTRAGAQVGHAAAVTILARARRGRVAVLLPVETDDFDALVIESDVA